MSVETTVPMLEAALGYAARGWQVFPCDPNDKRPLVARESSPGARDGGVHLASTDPDTIRAWWRTRPRAMIGLRMGTGCGAFAIDVDSYKADGETGEVLDFSAIVARIEAEIGEVLPPTLTSETPRGGRHLFFAVPEGYELSAVTNSRGGLPKIVDVRGDGGYVVVGPSVRAGPKAREEGCDGVAYRWLDDTVPIAEAPAALMQMIRREGRFAPAPALPVASGATTRIAAAGDAEAAAMRRYGLAALDNACGRLRSTPKGHWNQTLNDEALAIGHLVGAGAIDRATAHAALYGAAASWGIPANDKALKPGGTLDRALDDGARAPADLSEVRRNARERAERQARWQGRDGVALRRPEPPPADPEVYGGGVVSPAPSSIPEASSSHTPMTAPAGGSEDGGRQPPGGRGGPDLDCGRLPATDLGNAKRVLARHGRDFLFVREWGWLSWDGRRWRRDGAENRLEQAIQATVEAIVDEAAAIRRSDDDPVIKVVRGAPWRLSDELGEWAEKSQAAGHINCISGLVQSALARAPSDFDTDPMKINVENGTLDVRRRGPDEPYVRLHPHDRADLITKLAPVVYDPEAGCPQFDRFLEEVQPSAEKRRFLDQWAGVSLTGDATDQKLVILLGKGRNGKSVWMDTIAHVAGDYADTVPIETFLDQGRGRAAGAPTPELAMLAGVRCLRTSEPKKGSRLDEALIKLATGGEPMKVRELNKGYFTLVVQFKMTIQSNYRPQITGTDDGIWGRIILIVWPVYIPKAKRDRRLTLKLRGEASGILNRMLAGLCDWLDNGLVVADEDEAATAAYQRDSDPLGRFLEECTRPTIGARSRASDVLALFNAWGRTEGEGIEWSAKGLSNALVDRGLSKVKSSEVFWLDLELTRQPWEFAARGSADEDHRE